MTTITIERELLEQALNALLLPCDRWNGVQYKIVKAVTDALLSALAAPATAPDLSAAYIGAREDLAIWKKRALEAEKTARQLNRALADEVNGPTFMGEPVLPATAPEQDGNLVAVTKALTSARIALLAVNSGASMKAIELIDSALNQQPATAPAQPAPERKPMTDEEVIDLVRECGLDWHKGFMPLFDDDPTNRFAVLVSAVEAFHGIKGTP